MGEIIRSKEFLTNKICPFCGQYLYWTYEDYEKTYECGNPDCTPIRNKVYELRKNYMLAQTEAIKAKAEIVNFVRQNTYLGQKKEEYKNLTNQINFSSKEMEGFFNDRGN